MKSTSIPNTAQAFASNKDTNNLRQPLISEHNTTENINNTVALPQTADAIFKELLKGVEKINFETLAFSGTFSNNTDVSKKSVNSANNETDAQQKNLSGFNLTKNHYVIICVEQIINLAISKNWGLCKKSGSVYLYNGAYWTEIERERFQFFLGEVALKMGVEKFKGKIHTFKSDLYKQFMSDAFMTTSPSGTDEVLINLQNGTFEITPAKRVLRDFDQKDFLTHQLPFEYNIASQAPQFQKYLDEVLPDRDKQKVLAEYMGYIFIKPTVLKLEKVLLLYGTGANGKSVFFEIINALLGSENISNFSLQSLTDEKGYTRAKLRGKLLNYVSELNANFETSVFKQLASGEAVEARLPYKEPFSLTDYAKLMFNCNELPKESELTNAFFRRFLIINFDVTVAECDQDKQLSNKIIASELSGVFNWILEGLERLLLQNNFSTCAAIDDARSAYERQSDSVYLFIAENGFEASATEHILISELYPMYIYFCKEEGFKLLGKSKFIARLNHLKLFVTRKNVGNVVSLSGEVKYFNGII